MTAHSEIAELQQINRLAARASELGYEIVDLAGFLDVVETQSREQRTALAALTQSAIKVETANADMREATEALTGSTRDAVRDVKTSADTIRGLGTQTTTVAGWVQDLRERTQSIGGTLDAVKDNNTQIAAIAMQVNTLAINAKIEAARAGDAGRGFAVVAEAINALSQKTKDAATRITRNIESLTDWISLLDNEAQTISNTAETVIDLTGASDNALTQIENSMQQAFDQVARIADRTQVVGAAMASFSPNLAGIEAAVTHTTNGIKSTHDRINRLIDRSEQIVQSSAALGGTTKDAPMIDYVRQLAATAGARLEQAIATGQITQAQMFDRTYRPVPGSDPVQVVTDFTRLMDQVMPEIQEPALKFDDRVVFCAAVDVNGYLPTHNRKFSQPQGPDPVWNMANCRNRRIFDDRVGLKAGRNTDPFLLQVYRRDMGGGEFAMMKDLSAPIFINGTLWGGLRLAYRF
ncbi:chemotaxis protein [Sulfitobacter pseudonitzschiae]|uniref:Chemotaxis protein n=1 Tax=Pseudosulfitobacter pseudonitzschiae TaxID=1402135 RepID=A0A9Q2P2L7_9RHOB|nr:methyl-accepting chemotaxis protein [Pseudosulfitobacter pseudonitzschiae]MBM2292783.1 chemotaxis protein [Pseudosulfitobacter pseudonitzschiae]MBM2298121.1 chemotaxis protein [Pseudosulfitobacter pseudonitzschiae]MBM2303035.1 chemotaxis protein [Pseudosulfitobacter pseudonitzschiae]MBM2312818.1 chemotaxis protein [Pseudosulfitobacter pseudonitzschiae]MBM2317731.1 chemotaxis protein [Pseudosulfitobacter pseudonitzschiae]